LQNEAPEGGQISEQQLTDPLIVVFDCDATLSSLEGIDWLAERNGVGAEVIGLTAGAVAGNLALEEVYAERLRRVDPTPADLAALAEAYVENVIEDAAEVIAALQACGYPVWVVSGGLADAVVPFADWLGVDADHVVAVPVRWEANDRWAETADNPLAHAGGKARVIARLRAGVPAVLVGDGATDAEARSEVRCLIGYGGVKSQPAVRVIADAWINCRSLAPVVPMIVGRAGHPKLETSGHADVWVRGLTWIETGDATGGCPRPSVGR
jgi:phosphoserine phosphatase